MTIFNMKDVILRSQVKALLSGSKGEVSIVIICGRKARMVIRTASSTKMFVVCKYIISHSESYRWQS